MVFVSGGANPPGNGELKEEMSDESVNIAPGGQIVDGPNAPGGFIPPEHKMVLRRKKRHAYGSLNPDRCFCKKCAASRIEEGMTLPIVISPRVGVCGYCG
jgi:hypothetical protein